MAQKRMFDKTITNSDDFLELPDSSQVLYFHLSMNADDDGFINNWKSIMKMTGTKEDDLKILIAKQYIIPFDSGVIVMRHWRINNYLRSDRYKETKFIDEKSQLLLGKNEEYTLDKNVGIPTVYPDKNSIDKNSIEEKEIYKEKEIKNKYGEFNNVLLTKEEYHKLEQANLLPYIEKLSSYIASKGKKYKSHYATILTWSRGDKQTKTSIEPEWLDKEIKPKVNKEAEEFERRFFEELEKEQKN